MTEQHKTITKEDLLKNIEEYNKKNLNGLHHVYYECFNLLEKASKEGKREVYIPIKNKFYCLESNQDFFVQRFTADGFNCSRKRRHSFQCDCDEKDGCVNYFVIEF